MTFTQAKLIIWNPKAYDLAMVRIAAVLILCSLRAGREDLDQAALVL